MREIGGEAERGEDPTRPDQTKQYEKKTMQSLYTIIYCVYRFLLLLVILLLPSVAFPFPVLVSLLSFFQKRRFSTRIFDCANKQKKKKLNLKANFIQKHLICADRGKKLLQQQEENEAQQEPGTEIPREFCRFSADVTSLLVENPTQSSIIIISDQAPYCCSPFTTI